MGLGVRRCYIVYNITASAIAVVARCQCYYHLLATISRWDEVPLPRPPEESLSSGGVQAVCSMGANTQMAGGHDCSRCPEKLRVTRTPIPDRQLG